MRSLHFLYHELRPAKSRYSYVMACDEFEEHCALFAQMQQSAPESVLRPEITFDDGNASDLMFASPVLRRHGLRATFFITAGWTGERAGFMDFIQLRALQAAGHRIGAHGLTHKLLTACSDAELDAELRVPKARLEQGLGTEVPLMSLPGGRANARVLRACAAAGYRQVYTSEPRAEAMDAAPFTVGRFNLHSGTTLNWLEQVLRPETGALAKLQRADQLKTTAKRVLGDRLYARLWALANRQEAQPLETGASLP